jgi:hypothetical protein
MCAAVLVPSGVILFLLIVAVLLFLIFGRRRRERFVFCPHAFVVKNLTNDNTTPYDTT